MKFIVSGNGRKVGAIGIFHPFTCEVEANSLEEAKILVYDQYDHITSMKVEKLDEPLLNGDK